MKLLLDEMFSPLLAEELRRRGHDVLAIKERPEWHALSDADVLALARLEGRAVVTNNVRDFRPLHAEALASRTGHFGMVFVPSTVVRSRAATGVLADALDAVLARQPRDLIDSEEWL